MDPGYTASMQRNADQTRGVDLSRAPPMAGAHMQPMYSHHMPMQGPMGVAQPMQGPGAPQQMVYGWQAPPQYWRSQWYGQPWGGYPPQQGQQVMHTVPGTAQPQPVPQEPAREYAPPEPRAGAGLLSTLAAVSGKAEPLSAAGQPLVEAPKPVEAPPAEAGKVEEVAVARVSTRGWATRKRGVDRRIVSEYSSSDGHSERYIPDATDGSSTTTSRARRQARKRKRGARDAAGEASGDSRRRTSQACKRCRARKRRCTGERPTCSRCEGAGAACVYEPANHNGVAQHVLETMTSLREQNQRLSSRLRHVACTFGDPSFPSYLPTVSETRDTSQSQAFAAMVGHRLRATSPVQPSAEGLVEWAKMSPRLPIPTSFGLASILRAAGCQELVEVAAAGVRARRSRREQGSSVASPSEGWPAAAAGATNGSTPAYSPQHMAMLAMSAVGLTSLGSAKAVAQAREHFKHAQAALECASGTGVDVQCVLLMSMYSGTVLNDVHTCCGLLCTAIQCAETASEVLSEEVWGWLAYLCELNGVMHVAYMGAVIAKSASRRTSRTCIEAMTQSIELASKISLLAGIVVQAKLPCPISSCIFPTPPASTWSPSHPSPFNAVPTSSPQANPLILSSAYSAVCQLMSGDVQGAMGHAKAAQELLTALPMSVEPGMCLARDVVKAVLSSP